MQLVRVQATQPGNWGKGGRPVSHTKNDTTQGTSEHREKDYDMELKEGDQTFSDCPLLESKHQEIQIRVFQHRGQLMNKYQAYTPPIAGAKDLVFFKISPQTTLK